MEEEGVGTSTEGCGRQLASDIEMARVETTSKFAGATRAIKSK